MEVWGSSWCGLGAVDNFPVLHHFRAEAGSPEWGRVGGLVVIDKHVDDDHGSHTGWFRCFDGGGGNKQCIYGQIGASWGRQMVNRV